MKAKGKAKAKAKIAAKKAKAVTLKYGYPVDHLFNNAAFLSKLLKLHSMVQKGKLKITLKRKVTKNLEGQFNLVVQKTSYSKKASFSVKMLVARNSMDKCVVVDFKLGNIKEKKI